MNDRRQLPNRRRHELVSFEHDGIRFTAGFGRFSDGKVAEVFIDCERRGSAVEIAARDAAIAASIALQCGASLTTLRHALTRLSNGRGAGPLGVALDLVVEST